MTAAGNHHRAIVPRQATACPGKLTPPYAVDGDDPLFSRLSSNQQPPVSMWITGVPRPRSPRSVLSEQSGQHGRFPRATANHHLRGGCECGAESPLSCSYNSANSDRRHERAVRESDLYLSHEPAVSRSQSRKERPVNSRPIPEGNSPVVAGPDPHNRFPGEGSRRSQSRTDSMKPGRLTNAVPTFLPAAGSWQRNLPSNDSIPFFPQDGMEEVGARCRFRGFPGREKTGRKRVGQYDSVYSTDYVNYYAAHGPCQWRDAKDEHSHHERAGLPSARCPVPEQSWPTTSALQSAPPYTPRHAASDCLEAHVYPENTTYSQRPPCRATPPSASCPDCVSHPCPHKSTIHRQPRCVTPPEEIGALQCCHGRTTICDHCCCTNVRDASPVTCRSRHSPRGVSPVPETLCNPHFNHAQVEPEAAPVTFLDQPAPIAGAFDYPDAEGYVRSHGGPAEDFGYTNSRTTSQWQAYEGADKLAPGARRGSVTPRSLGLPSFDPKDYK
ncbi:hypothetical protein CSUI_010120 [Cystoisospora suis]|uniref:Uncharacterized protein n=1 Tax=Cystoisospora suis TaxID=483139 RepID=A0A2C6KEV4_9APIC|nr:hypothetical protein CSUI_010120 [Cystoisospora suis]